MNALWSVHWINVRNFSYVRPKSSHKDSVEQCVTRGSRVSSEGSDFLSHVSILTCSMPMHACKQHSLDVMTHNQWVELYTVMQRMVFWMRSAVEMRWNTRMSKEEISVDENRKTSHRRKSTDKDRNRRRKKRSDSEEKTATKLEKIRSVHTRTASFVDVNDKNSETNQVMLIRIPTYTVKEKNDERVMCVRSTRFGCAHSHTYSA